MTNETNKTDQRRLPVDMYPVLPLCWATLDDTDLADAIEELDDWVSWVIDRYALDYRTIPPCWDKHGALIEELSALRTAWFAAFSGTSRPEAPLEWHYHFAAGRQRLTDWVARTGCRPGDHRGK